MGNSKRKSEKKEKLQPSSSQYYYYQAFILHFPPSTNHDILLSNVYRAVF